MLGAGRQSFTPENSHGRQITEIEGQEQEAEGFREGAIQEEQRRTDCRQSQEVGFDWRSSSAGSWTQSLAAPIGGGLLSQQLHTENCRTQLDGGLVSPPRVTVISGFSPSTEIRLEPELAQPTSKMRCSPRPI